MDDNEVDRVLAKIVALAKDNDRLEHLSKRRAEKIEELEPRVRNSEQAQRWLDAARKDAQEARAKVLEWEKFRDALRALGPAAKPKNWPKFPEPFDEIPF